MLCFECLEEIGKERVCSHCGTEIFPTVADANEILKKMQKKGKRLKTNKKNDEINQWFDMELF